jgi:hypothetical protein
MLQAHEHRRLEQKTLAAYTGLAETTLSNWTVGATDLSQIEALLRLLERLPQAARTSLVNNFLRLYPSFASSQLAHDPLAVDGLRALLQQTRGLTFIQGPEDGLRTFVLTALGHEASRVGAGVRPVAGLDLHADSSLVPVPGMIYLGGRDTSADLHARILPHWPPDQLSNLVLLNRIWSGVPQLQPEILTMAQVKHVVAADDSDFTPRTLRSRVGSSGLPAQILSVARLPGDRITVNLDSV